MATAQRALSVANRLQATREKKFTITDITMSVDRVGQIVTLNDPDQGLSDSQRVGDRIQCERVSLRLWRVIPGSATGRFSCRFLIILDKQNTITNANQIFINTDSAYAPLLSYVKDYRRQFVVLYDSGSNHMDQYNKGQTTRFTRRVQAQTRFAAASNQITTGAIKLVAISNQGAGANNRPILIGSLRVDYTDN